jgi:peptide/nickel transport system ATP-binding protein
MTESVLAYQNVSITYSTGTRAARQVSFELHAGECLALVGESGCGKTTLARAALGLLPDGTRVIGSILIHGTEIVGASPQRLRTMRGLEVGLVAQDPFEACNPLDRVERHVAEAWRAHGRKPPRQGIANALTNLGIRDAETRMTRYPHQWSGGMLQRATITAAAAHQPPLIIADEPTSALDADLAEVTLHTLRKTGAAVLLVSHDIGVVTRHADRVAVVYAGRIVEIADAQTVLQRPRHPYTIALLQAIPQPDAGLPEPLAGTPPDLAEEFPGCAFAPRCRYAAAGCHTAVPELVHGVACPVLAPHGHRGKEWERRVAAPPEGDNDVGSDFPDGSDGVVPVKCPSPIGTVRNGDRYVAEAHGVSKIYDQGAKSARAVVRASLQVQPSEIVGIGGPSGCGKSTFLRMLATIEPPSAGAVYLNGQCVATSQTRRITHKLARSGYVMPIFQDPVGSLDRRWPIWRTITEPLTAQQRLSQQHRRAIAAERLEEVGLAHIDLDARPHELSVGQCQRISIARALIARPALIVADEPTSALDASVSAAILHLLAAVAAAGTAIVIVSHDQAVLRALCHRVLAMRDGVLGESG